MGESSPDGGPATRRTVRNLGGRAVRWTPIEGNRLVLAGSIVAFAFWYLLAMAWLGLVGFDPSSASKSLLSSGVASGLLALITLGLSIDLPRVTVNAGLLVAVNTVSINLAALATRWYTGYRPSGWWKQTRALVETRRRMAAMALVVLMLSGALVVFTVGAYESATARETVRNSAGSVLDDPAYREVELREVGMTRDGGPLDAEPEGVTVTVRRPSGEQYPRLEDRIDRRIESRFGREVDTDVRFVSVAEAD